MEKVRLQQSLGDLRWVIVAILISIGFWYWVFHILAPANAAVVRAAHRPIGNNSDLYPRWLGTRELLLHRRDPYSPEVTREIQTGFYGRPLDPSKPSDPIAQESFVYPLYVAFLLAPTISLPFHIVAAIFRWILLGAVAASVPVWMYGFGLRVRWSIIAAGMLLATSTSPGMYEYFQQNLASLAVLFVASAVAAIVGKRPGTAGVLLALSTIKPDTTGPIVAWLLVWAAARIRTRGPVLWWFLGTIGLLTIGGEFYSPHWIGRFFSAIREYPAYGTDPSVVQVLFPRSIAVVLTLVLIGYVCVLVWRWRTAAPASEQFASAIALIAATTLVTLPKLAGYNALLLIPGVLVLIGWYSRSFARGILSRGLTKAVFACQIWQWLAAAVLTVASFVLSATRMRALAHLPDYTFVPLWPITLLALLVVATQATKKRDCVAKPMSVQIQS